MQMVLLLKSYCRTYKLVHRLLDCKQLRLAAMKVLITRINNQRIYSKFTSRNQALHLDLSVEVKETMIIKQANNLLKGPETGQ